MKLWEAVPPSESNESGFKESPLELTDSEVIEFLSTHSYDLARAMHYTPESGAAKEKARYDKFVIEFKKANGETEIDEERLEQIAEETYEEVEKEKKSEGNPTAELVLLNRFHKEIRKHKRFRRLNFKYVKETDEAKYTPYKALMQLVKMANEMSSVRLIAGLNQGLPNNPADLLEFARKFENILFDKVPSKECEPYKVNNFF